MNSGRTSIEIENIKKMNQNQRITAMKNKLQGLSSRLKGSEEWVGNLEDRLWKSSRLNSKKTNFKMRIG